MRRLMIGLSLLVIMNAGWSSVHAEEEPDDLVENAKSAILIERDTGKILYNKQMDEPLPPASMTKVMTLLLVMEAVDAGKMSFDETITISENASSMGGSQVFLETGEEMTVDDLVKAIAVASGNDASVALAERLAGSEEAFVKEMNQKAKELGLEHTTFKNASGLPAKDHHSSAHDMALMSKELLKYEQITKYTSLYEDYLRQGKDNEFWLVNTNKLVNEYPYVDGLKTGYTKEAKHSLTATGKKNDMRLIAVVMGAETVKERNAMVMELLDYGFGQYDIEKLYDKNEQVAELEMLESEKLVYPVKTGEQISLLHKKGEPVTKQKPEITLETPSLLPLEKGQKVGELTVTDGEDKLTSPLVLEEELKSGSYWDLWQRSLARIAKKAES